MRNTTWRKRRLKKGLDISEVANYLDISYERYALIDKGDVKMPNKYIEKFNELINKSKGERQVNRLTREEMVNNWWDEMSVKLGRGQFKLNEKMKEFNIDTLCELDSLLGYSASGSMSNYLNGYQSVGFDVKNKIYSFFENELNIQPPKTKNNNAPRQARGVQNTPEYSELLEWYKSFDLKSWRNTTGLTNKDIVKKSGLSDGTVHNIMYKHFQTPCIATMRKLKYFIDNYTEIIETKPVAQTMVFTSVPIEEVPEDVRKMGQELVKEVNENMTLKEKLTEKYEAEIERITAIIEQHEIIIADLRRDKDVYEKVLADLNED